MLLPRPLAVRSNLKTINVMIVEFQPVPLLVRARHHYVISLKWFGFIVDVQAAGSAVLCSPRMIINLDPFLVITVEWQPST